MMMMLRSRPLAYQVLGGGGGQAAWTAAMPAHMDTMIQKGKKQHGVNMMGTGRTLQEQASGT